MSGPFAVQPQVRGAWARYLDELAPLRPELFRYCCGLTGDVWEGEDLAQDVLLRVFGQMGKSQAELSHPRAYLIRAATNLWLDRVRRAGVERSYVAAELAEPPAPGPPPASQAVEVREAAAGLFAALPPRERAAVLLNDVLDLSLAETAAMLKTSVAAVKALLHRGRGRLSGDAPAPAARPAPPRELVDRFCAALSARDVEALKALCLADVTVDMVGGAAFEGFEAGRTTFHWAHVVRPEWGFGERPHWRVAAFRGEPIVLGFRTLDGVEGLNEIWRVEEADDAIARLRLYCFSPEILRAVAEDLRIPFLRRPYRPPG